MMLWEALEKLDDLVDTSDPDISLPNVQHLLQSAEVAALYFLCFLLLHCIAFALHCILLKGCCRSCLDGDHTATRA